MFKDCSTGKINVKYNQTFNILLVLDLSWKIDQMLKDEITASKYSFQNSHNLLDSYF